MRDLGSGALKQETISDTRNYLVLCFWGRDGQHVLYSWSTVPSLYLLLFLVQQGLPSPFCEVLGHCDKFQKQSAITAILLSTPYCKKVVSSQPNKVVGWCAFILPARARDLPGKEQQVTSALPLAACRALLAPAFPGQCLLRARRGAGTAPARCRHGLCPCGLPRTGTSMGTGSAHREGKALLLGAARFSLLWDLQAENPMPGSGGWCFLSQHSQLLHAVLGKNLGWCPRKCKFYNCFWQAGR